MFLQGGFARCYELVDSDTREVLAGKIVSKMLLVKQHQKEKMTQEITIQRELNHKHIVGFSTFFEDSDNVYIILELCRKRVSLSVGYLSLKCEIISSLQLCYQYPSLLNVSGSLVGCLWQLKSC